jgi:hypothetical protein
MVMPVILVVLGSGLGTVSACIALLADLGALLAVGLWLSGGLGGLAAALRPVR